MNFQYPEQTYPYQSITKEIIHSAFHVHQVLGWGLLEKIYENALAIEIQQRNLYVETQKNYPVFYQHQLIGDYRADLVVERKIIVEIKAVPHFAKEHISQLLNYLKLSGLKLGLLINFKKETVEIKRIIL